MFRASFARSTINTNVMADHTADAKFMPANLLNNIQRNLQSIEYKSLNLPHVFCGVTGNPYSTGSSTVKLDVFSQIRHGMQLVLRNIQLKITKEEITTLHIVRKVPESVGCDNREMLAPARDRYGDEIEATR